MKASSFLFSALFILVLVLIFSFSPRTVRKIQSGCLSFVSPFLNVGSELRIRAEAFIEDAKGAEAFRAENKRLQEENAYLRILTREVEQLRREGNELRADLNFLKTAPLTVIPARVTNYNRSLWESTIDINRGEEHGVPLGAPVLIENGLVGKTILQGKKTTRVLLLSDEKCQVAAKIQGTIEKGILMGRRENTESNPLLLLKFLDKRAKLKPGMLVFSSGAGEVFPSGVLLGRVVRFKSGDLYGEAFVQPAVNFKKLKTVFIIAENKEKRGL